MEKNISISLNNQTTESLELVHRLFETLSDQSPSDANVSIEIVEKDNRFLGNIEIISSNLKLSIQADEESFMSLIISLKQLFTSEIINWRKERTL